ncbi:sterol desaturase family protein [Aquipseudomonas alcaligenes]|uniref:sterol desaturase family protein n=1 Tax=Aquipseudomonas alcaligenes TaxID=43263 RepID=UPI000DF8BD75|nr:sterol desaturase family protein [Pseudomonas alcaligenes]SUD14118.1 sterol desaturase [Pseudomonas alcaligenes]
MWDQVYLFATSFFSSVISGVQAYAEEALIFFVLAVLLNRGEIKPTLSWLFPKSVRVNFISYLVDFLFVAASVWAAVVFLWGDIQFGLFGRYLYNMPDALVLFLTIFLADMVGYFRHRLEHTRLLWPSHVLHHSDADMTWMAIYRFHPINRLTTSVIDSGALFVVGFPAWAIAINYLVRHYYGAFIHANLPWTYGWLGKVFVSPAMHRWHHVREGQGVGSNFATVFSVFDLLFKTYYVPGPCNVPLGVNGINDQSYLSQLLLPVTASWRAIARGFGRMKGVKVEER